MALAYWVKKYSSLNHWDESMELMLWNGLHFPRTFLNIDPCLFGPIAFNVCLSCVCVCVLHACIMHKIKQFWNLTRIHYRKIQYRISVCYPQDYFTGFLGSTVRHSLADSSWVTLCCKEFSARGKLAWGSIQPYYSFLHLLCTVLFENIFFNSFFVARDREQWNACALRECEN